MSLFYPSKLKSKKLDNVNSIIFIQTAFIGDVILATALIEAWKKEFPNSSIDFLVRAGNEGILSGHPIIRNLYLFDKSRKLKNILHLIKCFRRNKYDIAVNVQRYASTGIITTLSGAKVTVGFKKNPLSLFFSIRVGHKLDGRHEINRNHALISPWVGSMVCLPKLYPSTKDEMKVNLLKKGKYFTISPASVWFTKQFPKSKWIELLDNLEPASTIYLLGGKSDGKLCDEIIGETTHNSVVSMAGKLSILQSATLMKEAEMNFVNDSAPLHIASAMNAPVTAIFCSTVPKFGYVPLSDNNTIVETKEPLACRPCGLHGYKKCPKTHFKCAQSITINQLINK